MKKITCLDVKVRDLDLNPHKTLKAVAFTASLRFSQFELLYDIDVISQECETKVELVNYPVKNRL